MNRAENGVSRGGPAALSTVDAAYRIELPLRDWLAGIVAAARPCLYRNRGMLATSYRVGEHGVRLDDTVALEAPATEELAEIVKAQAASMPAWEVANTYGYSATLESGSTTIERISRGSEPGAVLEQRLGALATQHDVADILVARGVDATGRGVMLASYSHRREAVSRVESARWARVVAHVLAGLRLRESLAGAPTSDGEAVLEPDGRVVHAEDVARRPEAREALRVAARRIEQARTRDGRRDPDAALAAWKALVAGRWSIIDRFDSDGRRYLVARRNDPRVSGSAILTLRERHVAAYSVLGYSNKQIAYALGLAESTISTHLRSAMQKVGAGSRADLAAIFR